MTGVVELVIVIALAAGMGWLSLRAWRLSRPGARLAAGLASALGTLLLAVVAVLGLLGVYQLYMPRGGAVATLSAQITADQLIVATRRASGCRGCHSSGQSPALDGGTTNLLGGTPGPGVLVAPNLTPAGPLKY